MSQLGIVGQSFWLLLLSKLWRPLYGLSVSLQVSPACLVCPTVTRTQLQLHSQPATTSPAPSPSADAQYAEQASASVGLTGLTQPRCSS